MAADTASLEYKFSQNGQLITPNPPPFEIEDDAFYNAANGVKVIAGASNVLVPLANTGTISQIVFYLNPIDINETNITIKVNGSSEPIIVCPCVPLTNVSSATVSSSYTDATDIRELKWEAIAI